MSIDERIEALTHSLELLQHSVEDVKEAIKEQGRNLDRVDKRTQRFEAIVLRLGAYHAERIGKMESKLFGSSEPMEGTN
jgi:hypothetical protein